MTTLTQTDVEMPQPAACKHIAAILNVAAQCPSTARAQAVALVTAGQLGEAEAVWVCEMISRMEERR